MDKSIIYHEESQFCQVNDIKNVNYVEMYGAEHLLRAVCMRYELNEINFCRYASNIVQFCGYFWKRKRTDPWGGFQSLSVFTEASSVFLQLRWVHVSGREYQEFGLNCNLFYGHTFCLCWDLQGESLSKADSWTYKEVYFCEFCWLRGSYRYLFLVCFKSIYKCGLFISWKFFSGPRGRREYKQQKTSIDSQMIVIGLAKSRRSREITPKDQERTLHNRMVSWWIWIR